jgi:hypothetical protein
MRLTLLPNLRQLWRDPRTLQLGTDPSRAVVLEFSDPIAARVLDLLDGSRTESEVIEDATRMLALDSPDAKSVLNSLWAAGLLVDTRTLLPAGLPEPTRRRLLPEAAALALRRRHPGGCPGATRAAFAALPNPDESLADGPMSDVVTASDDTPAHTLERRRAARVLITGAEPLVAPIAVTLAGSGIGHVDPTVTGRGRPPDILGAIARTAPDTRVCPIRAGTATVVVRIGQRSPAVPTGRWRRSAILTIGMRDGTVLVGPMVRPQGSPCERCLDLHRNDRDPAWPVLAAQLATDSDEVETCALTTTLAAAAYAAEEVLSYVDQRMIRTDGAAVEISRPGESRRRSWPAHPRCDCLRRISTLSIDTAPPAGRNET